MLSPTGRVIAIVLGVCILPLSWLGIVSPANADGKCEVTVGGCFAKADTSRTTTSTKDRPGQAESGSRGGEVNSVDHGSAPKSEFDEVEAAILAWQHQDAVCELRTGPGTVGCAVQFGPEYEPEPAEPGEPDAEPVPVVTITPYQAAVTAAAYLPLQPGKPTVGPPPQLNKWKMAAVGYPLWIWADGDLNPAPVSRTVSGLSVSLDANLTKITYDMGDGTKLTCGPGTPWRKGSVPAGTPSPDCGHTYAQPSLPKGEYTITATTTWSVAWTAGGQSGTIPFTQTSTTTVPVGEVQTLVR